MNIRELVKKHFDTAETVVLLIFAASFFTVFIELQNASYYFGTGAILMAILYWFKASERSETAVKINIKQKIIWYGLMITPIAIYSKVKMDENSNIFMGLALGMLIVAFFVRLHQKIAKQEDVPASDFVRIIAAIIVALSIFALPLPNIN